MLIGNFAASVLLKPNINSAACAFMSNNYEDIQSAICKLMRAAMKTANWDEIMGCGWEGRKVVARDRKI